MILQYIIQNREASLILRLGDDYIKGQREFGSLDSSRVSLSNWSCGLSSCTIPRCDSLSAILPPSGNADNLVYQEPGRATLRSTVPSECGCDLHMDLGYWGQRFSPMKSRTSFS